MNEMYIRIETLCVQRGVNITKMCREADVPRGNITDLKNGRTAALSTKNLTKLSVYFNVSIDRFLGTEQKETPTGDGGRGISDNEVKLALFGGGGDVTDEMWNEALFAVELIKKRHEKGK